MRHFHCIESNCGKHKGWRCWIYPFANILGSHHDRVNVGIEFYPWTDVDMPGFNVYGKANDEHTIGFSVNVPFLFSLYVHADLAKWGYSKVWRKILRLDEEHKYDGRSWGIKYIKNSDCIDGGYLSIELGRYDNCWSSKDPKWLHTSIHPRVVLCGRATYSEQDNGTTQHTVTIKGNKEYADKEYVLNCKEFISTWTWKRFKKPYSLKRYEVSTQDKDGVPHPGKGTTCYNCEESALQSQTSPANSREEAVAKFVESVHWYRKNYPL